MYPCLTIDTKLLKHNTDFLFDKLSYLDELYVVTKGYSAYLPIISLLNDWGVKRVADSRVMHLKSIKENFPDFKTMQIRLVMPCEVEDVIKYVDRSLNSELSTIKLLNDEAIKQNKQHEILLMFDVGDLREGLMFNSNYLDTVKEITKLSNIKLIGIGTNVKCYGCILPSYENMSILVDIKNNIEKELNIEIPIISGGNSSALFMALDHEMPKEINNLRLGDSFFSGLNSPYYIKRVNELKPNVFQLHAQIIELKDKPSYPIGEKHINAFSEDVSFKDVGIHTRAIIALGRLEVLANEIFPVDSRIKILGSSSDHIILEIKDNDYQVGDIITFNLEYGAIMSCFASNHIRKEMINY